MLGHVADKSRFHPTVTFQSPYSCVLVEVQGNELSSVDGS